MTLTGPGGVGKTTLARLSAQACRDDFGAEVVVFEIADVPGPARVVGAVRPGPGGTVAQQ